MAILEFQTIKPGESGVVPKIITINTNNSVAEVTTVGYLDPLVSQGVEISDYDIAVVTTRVNPNDVLVSTGMYTISYVGKLLKLTPLTAGSLSEGWLVDGSNSGSSLKFGTDTADGWIMQAGGSQFGSVSATGQVEYTKQFQVNDTTSSALVLSNLTTPVPTPPPAELLIASEGGSTYYSKGSTGYLINEGEGIRIESVLNDAAKIELYTKDHITISASGVAGFIETSGSELRLNCVNTNIFSVLTNYTGEITLQTLPTPAPLESISVVWDPVGKKLYDGGAATGFNPAANYTTGDPNGPITGNYEYTGKFTVNSGSGNVQIQSSADLNLYSEPVAGVARLSGFNTDVSASNILNLNSNNNNVNVTANNGNLNLSGNAATLSSNTFLNVYSSNGDFNINTNSGNLNVFAGTGPTFGGINMGSTDAINIYSNTQTVNINANDPIVGSVGMNASNASWGVSIAGLSGGVSAGSGMIIDAATGNVQFGASTGTFLMGALANTVDIIAGTVLSITAGTSASLVTSAGNLTLEATAGVVKVVTQTQASAAGAPTIQPPAGYSYVIMEDATGNIYRMT